MPIRIVLAILVSLALAVVASPALAQQPLLRSDLPLFTDGSELSPRSFFDDQSFGCSTILHFGDYRSPGDSDNDWDEWWRVTNYGVFHCALMFYTASGRDDLNTAHYSYAWVAPLGESMGPQGEGLELFALQIGALGGSEYLLLARPVEREANEWHLLDARCPHGAVRRSDSLDIWRTDYCAIDSARTLRRMARRAAGRSPAAIFTWVGRAPSQDSFLPADVESFLRRTRECSSLFRENGSSEEDRRWTTEALADFGCASLDSDGYALSERHGDRPEVRALIGALLEELRIGN